MSNAAVGASASASGQLEHPNPTVVAVADPAATDDSLRSRPPCITYSPPTFSEGSPRSVASMSSAGQDLKARSASLPGLQQHDDAAAAAAAAMAATSPSPSGPPRVGFSPLSPSDSSASLAEIRRSIMSTTSLGQSQATSPNPRPRTPDKSPAKFLQRSHTVRASSPADFLRRTEQLQPDDARSPPPSLEQIPRTRTRSLSPPARSRGSSGLFDDGMGSWLREKLTYVIGKMREQLREALDEVEAIPAGPSVELVVKEQIQTLAKHLLAATDDCNTMSSTDFQQTISALGKLLAHRSGPLCEEVIKKILLAIGHPARLLECLEFDPNAPAEAGRSVTEAQAASVRMTLDNSHLPRYILDKMTSSFDRSNSQSDIPDNAETMAAHAKFLDLLEEGEMPCKSDFRMDKLISSGAYGSVFIATHKITDEQFAVKVLKKKELQQKNCVNQVMAEKEVLRFAQNPFVIQFFCSFSSQHTLYIVMEYASGGDLGALVQAMGCLTEREARRYFAETVLAVEYIHEFNIIHRDLKPENLVISASGHIKLTDFGLSKIGMVTRTMRIMESRSDADADSDSTGVRGLPVPGTTGLALPPQPQPLSGTLSGQVSPARRRSSPRSPDVGTGETVGTPDYMAPEVILGQDYGAPADWWSMGIILFEFVVGIPPFTGESTEDIFDNAVSRDLDWADDDPEDPLSDEVKDLVGLLLEKRPALRLGSAGQHVQPVVGVGTLVEDINQIKTHPFFQLRLEDNGCVDPGIAWDSLLVEKACIVPTLDHSLDTSYFDDRTNRYPVRLSSSENSSRESSGFDPMSPLGSPLSPNLRDSLFKNFDSLNMSPGPGSPQAPNLSTVFAEAKSPLRSSLASGSGRALLSPPMPQLSNGGGGSGMTAKPASGDEDEPLGVAMLPCIDEHRTLASVVLTDGTSLGGGPDDPHPSADEGRIETYSVHWDEVTGLGLKVHTLWIAESWQHRIKEVNPDGPAAAVGVAPNCLLLKVNGVEVAGMDRDQMTRLIASTQDITAPVFVTLGYRAKARSCGPRTSAPAASNTGSYEFVARRTTHRRSKGPAKGKRRKNFARRLLGHAARKASRFLHEVARSLSPSPSRRHSVSSGDYDAAAADAAEPRRAEPRSRGRPKNRTRGGRHTPTG